MSSTKAFIITSKESRPEVVVPVLAALEVADVSTRAIDIGRVGSEQSSAVDRVLEVLNSPIAERRLKRESTEFHPDVWVVFDAGALQVLSDLRDRNELDLPVIAVVGELTPDKLWESSRADRYLVCDDESAFALSEMGVPGDLMVVVGLFGQVSYAVAAKEKRAQLKSRFSLPLDVPTVLVAAESMDESELKALMLHFSLVGPRALYLFDAGDSTRSAQVVRQQSQSLDLRAKLFGLTKRAPFYWRASDAIVAHPLGEIVSRAAMVNTPLVALGDSPDAIDGLEERGLAKSAPTPLLVGSVLSEILKKIPSRRGVGVDGAAMAADAIFLAASSREDLVREGRDSRVNMSEPPSPRVQTPTSSVGPAGELEDLGGAYSAEPTPRSREGSARSQRNSSRSNIDAELAALRSKAQRSPKSSPHASTNSTAGENNRNVDHELDALKKRMK